MNIPFDQLRDPRALQLQKAWAQRCSGAKLPSRRSFEPADFTSALGNIVLTEVMGDPARFRFKLVGSNIARHLGFDSTGHYLDQHPIPGYRDMLLSGYGEALQRRTPLAIRLDEKAAADALHCEAVLLPLSESGSDVTMFLTGVFFVGLPASAAASSFSAFAPPPDSLRAA